MGANDDDTTPLLANKVNTPNSNTYNSSSHDRRGAGPSRSNSASDTEDSSQTSPSDVENAPENGKYEKVGWMSLPRKRQLILLALCRLSEPICSTSLLSYVYYFIKSLPGADTPQEISKRAGMLVAVFAMSQFVTGMVWGRLSDIYGRKPIIVFGLLGSTLASLGLGFGKSFQWAMCMRMIAGGSNATAGVLRTVVAELIKEKKYQGRAFLIMPMCFNIGVIIGPILGGLLADPVELHPGLFGPGSWLGGKDGVGWMKEYPYALPNLVSATFLFCSCLAATFGLEETNPSGDIFHAIKEQAKKVWTVLSKPFIRCFGPKYQPLPQDAGAQDENEEPEVPLSKPVAVPYRDVLTPGVILCLLCNILLPLHNTTFMQLYPIFLSTPRHDNSHPSTPFSFNGGLGLPASQVGFGMATLGSIGILMQLFIYPPLQHRLGTLRSYRMSILLFPIVYFLTPFLAVLPSTDKNLEHPASGRIVWAGIVSMLFIQVTGRTFASPGNVILLINSVNNRRALGTVNGLAASLSSLARAIGPLTAGWAYGISLTKGVVGAVWWGMALVAMFLIFASSYIVEGKGFVAMEGEEEEEEDAKRAAAREREERNQERT